MGPHIRQACRNCVGMGIGWFYLRRPGDFDDDGTKVVPESASSVPDTEGLGREERGLRVNVSKTLEAKSRMIL